MTSSGTTDNLETDRTKRVKDAKNEAQKEIEDYRKQKEDEFKQYEQKVRTLAAGLTNSVPQRR